MAFVKIIDEYGSTQTDGKLIFLLQVLLEILITDQHPVSLDAEQLQDKWQNSLVNDANHLIFVKKTPHNINIMKFHLPAELSIYVSFSLPQIISSVVRG